MQRPTTPAPLPSRAPRALSLFLSLLALLGLAALGPQRAAAATLTVTDTTDDATDPGSLRSAIAQANADGGDDTITFAVTGTITLTVANGPLAITAPMTIQGPGAARLALDGGNTGGTAAPTASKFSASAAAPPASPSPLAA